MKVILTPLLTPLRALHPATVRNREQKNQLIYADSATYSNTWQQMSSDCGSEGRGFEPRRSPSHMGCYAADECVLQRLRNAF